MRTRIPLVSCAAAIAFHFAASGAVGAPILPDYGSAIFVPGTPVDNPYFPMLDPRTRVFEGQITEDGETTTERFELTNLGAGPVILGVQSKIQRDLSFEDGLLVERTFDYFAQDAEGNVW